MFGLLDYISAEFGTDLLMTETGLQI